VVKGNRVLYLSYENPPIGAAMSFNTVLSIPYALEHASREACLASVEENWTGHAAAVDQVS
jgi:hypothetical protein